MACFTDCLPAEIASIRYALVVAYEKRDRLLYVEGPQLREEYMEKIGAFEERVLKSELENTLLVQKCELIQAAINRREPVDTEKIDAELEKLRQQLLSKAEAGAAADPQIHSLSAEEEKELQRLYKAIVEKYHPNLHANLTEIQQTLYQKALDAYKRQNLDAMTLIYAMLFDDAATGMPQKLVTCKIDANADAQVLSDALATDYSLASQVWECFEPLESEMLLKKLKDQYVVQWEAVSTQIENIRKAFPFTAGDMLRDPQKISDYMDDLKARQRKSNNEKQILNQKIDQKLAEAAQYA